MGCTIAKSKAGVVQVVSSGVGFSQMAPYLVHYGGEAKGLRARGAYMC